MCTQGGEGGVFVPEGRARDALLPLLGAREAELRMGAAECLGLWVRQAGPRAPVPQRTAS